MTATRARAALALLAVGVAALAGCSSAGGAADATTARAAPDGERSSSSPDLSGDVVVLAAASLTDAFTALGERFEEDHPGVQVTFGLGASSALAQLVLAGAPADVLATASSSTMAQVGDLTGPPEVFATNTLQIAVPAGNPGGVTGVEDFADAGLTLALCAVEVPCGAAAQEMFAQAGVVPQPDTYEKDVSATLTKVVLGEVDAAVVYRTDVLAAGDAVEGVDVPDDVDVVNEYPVAVLADAPNPDAAAAFRDLVLSVVGAEALEAAGFVVS
jgi:molybdate transport system substrate-binding protein